MERGHRAVFGDGAADQLDRRLVVAALGRRHPQQMQAVGVARLGLQHLAVSRFGFGQAAGLVQADAGDEQGLQGCRVQFKQSLNKVADRTSGRVFHAAARSRCETGKARSSITRIAPL